MKLFAALFFLLAFASSALALNITGVAVAPGSLDSHHTKAYRLEKIKYLIVRRGDDFDLVVSFDSNLEANQSVSLETTPTLPNFVKSVKTANSEATVTCTTNSTTAIGSYTLTVSLVDSNSHPLGVTYSSQPLVILFNPWNAADDVHMDDTSLLDEYVNNEYQTIWRGSIDSYGPMRWYVAQFDESALTAALHLVQNFDGDASDVRLVSRFLSRATSAQRNNPLAVIWGNWGSDFSDGKNPSWWKGSNVILKQYVDTGFQVVKYAQCWVFGGVLLTLLRTLGVPSRQLTTFESAHETPLANGTYTHSINRYYNSKGRMVRQAGSVWNFHSWNDAWMKRPDSPNGDGWNAVDSTPQERSQGYFQMGPAPVAAVKRLDDSAPYDTPFVISEVSAVIHNYQVDDSGTVVKDLGIDETSVAGLITTVTPFKDSIQDITSVYKKVSSLFAASHLTRKEKKRLHKQQQLAKQGGFVAFLEAEDHFIGEPIDIQVLFMGLPATGDQRIDFFINASFTDYTGNYLVDLGNVTDSVLLTHDGRYQNNASYRLTDYWDDVTSIPYFVSLQIYAINTVTSQALAESISVHLQPPSLKLTGPKYLFENSVPQPVHMSFTNPLPIPLTNIEYEVSAPVFGLDTGVLTQSQLGAGETLHWYGTFSSSSVNGTQSILASLTCDQMSDVSGFMDILVLGVPEDLESKPLKEEMAAPQAGPRTASIRVLN